MKLIILIFCISCLRFHIQSSVLRYFSIQQKTEPQLRSQSLNHRFSSISSLTINDYPNLNIRVLAGTGTAGFSGDSGAATSAQLKSTMIWVDSNGNIYSGDADNFRIRKISSSSATITTFGGTGTASQSGNTGPIGSTGLYQPYSIVGDTIGSFLYLSDMYYLWQYSFSSNVVSVIAGTSTQGFSGDNGPAVSAQINGPRGIWLTTSGTLYFADYDNHRIRKITSGIISTVAGSGSVGSGNGGFAGNSGSATSATLNNPRSAFVNTQGKLFIADAGNNRIRIVDTNNIITTFAGNGDTAYNGDNQPATSASLNYPQDVKGDLLGNIIVADSYHWRVRLVDTLGIITTIIGSGSIGFTAGLAVASSSNIKEPSGLWLDSKSNIYFVDYNSIHQTVNLSPTSQPSSQPSRHPSSQPSSRPSYHSPTFLSPIVSMKLIAGGSSTGFSGDGAQATVATIYGRIPWVDSNGNIFIPDSASYRLRKVDVISGIITTFAGSGSNSNSGTSGSLATVSLYAPYSMVGDTAGTLFYLSDMYYIWKYSFANGIISVFAGISSQGFSGDGGQATSAALNEPTGLWLTTSGTLYVAVNQNHRVRKITANGIITTVAGTGTPDFTGDGGLATSATLQNPLGVYMDTNGYLFIADCNNRRIRMVHPTTNIITTIAGAGGSSYNGDGIPAFSANLNYPTDVKGDSYGSIFIADTSSCRVRMIDYNGIISTIFGGNSCSFTPGIFSPASSNIQVVRGLWLDSAGTLYFSDANSIHRSVVSYPTSQPSEQPTAQPSRQPTVQPIAKPSTQPSSQPSSRPSRCQPTFTSPLVFMKHIAGTSTADYGGDNGPATVAQLGGVNLWFDSAGNMYVADDASHRIRKVTPAGLMTTFGGTGTRSPTGTSGPMESVSFYDPHSIVGDPGGTLLYIADALYVWKYVFSTNIVTVVAHPLGVGRGFNGESGAATETQLNGPSGLWLTTSVILFIADYSNHRIRKLVSGILTTVVGSGPTGLNAGSFTGDNGPALSATLNYPRAVYVDTNGRLFIADEQNFRIRLVDTNNIITTFAGTGVQSPVGNNVPAISANVYLFDLRGDSLGNIYVAGNCVVSVINTYGIISTLFGTPGSCGFSSGISSRSSSLNNVYGLWLDSVGTLYFSDYNSVHRSITVSSPTSQPSGQPSRQPVTRPTMQPSNRPSRQPSSLPSSQPVGKPSAQPSLQPSSRPSINPPTFATPLVFMKHIAGINTAAISGDNGPAISAQIRCIIPWVDTVGNVYSSDHTNHCIRRITVGGIITTFGGTGNSGTGGTAGPISSVNFRNPYSIVGDTAGTLLYISDETYVWKYVFTTNIATAFAHSTSLAPGFNGDNGLASLAQLNEPLGLWLTTAGILYIADSDNNRIRKVVSEIITTVVGSGAVNGAGSFSGDNGPATSATLFQPYGLFMDSVGKLFIADYSNSRIRVVDTNGIITTFAGTGTASPLNGENIPAVSANINKPLDVKGDSFGNIYIGESVNCIVRMVDTKGIISTVFGNSASCGFTTGIAPRLSSMRNSPGLWVDSLSQLYISDYNSIHRSLVVSSPTSQPSGHPTRQPTGQPSSLPSTQPWSCPSNQPTNRPTSQPASLPSSQPTALPSCHPTSTFASHIFGFTGKLILFLGLQYQLTIFFQALFRILQFHSP
jgi:sugar lactone lactonase YvrE